MRSSAKRRTWRLFWSELHFWSDRVLVTDPFRGTYPRHPSGAGESAVVTIDLVRDAARSRGLAGVHPSERPSTAAPASSSKLDSSEDGAVAGICLGAEACALRHGSSPAQHRRQFRPGQRRPRPGDARLEPVRTSGCAANRLLRTQTARAVAHGEIRGRSPGARQSPVALQLVPSVVVLRGFGGDLEPKLRIDPGVCVLSVGLIGPHTTAHVWIRGQPRFGHPGSAKSGLVRGPVRPDIT